MALETFITTKSALFPDGTVVIGYYQEEEFDLLMVLKDENGAVRQPPPNWGGELVIEWHLGFVEIPSAGTVTIHSTTPHPTTAGLTSPRRLGDASVRDRLSGLVETRIPADLYTPDVALNEIHNVPIAACYLTEIDDTTAATGSQEVRRGRFGILVRSAPPRSP